jgi:CHAT domain-containing protein
MDATRTHLPDSFKKFKTIIHQIDLRVSQEKRMEILVQNEQILTKSLIDLKESKNWVHLGVMLEVLRQFETNLPVSFFNHLPSPDLCKGLDQNKKCINKEVSSFAFARSEKLYNAAMAGHGIRNYLDRHRFTENAIRLVWDLFPSMPEGWPYDYGKKRRADLRSYPSMPEDWPYGYPNFNEACRFIAKCYLLRSRLALPKGSDIPEKKIEAINLAWKWAEIIHGNHLNKLKTEIALERSRWDKNLPVNWLAEKLSDFSLPDHVDKWELVDFAAYDKGRELGLSHFPDRDADICGHFSKNKNPYFIFYQTKAAYRNRYEKLSCCLLPDLIDKLDGIPLSFPLWEDTVDLLYRIKNDDQKIWIDAAIAAWEACQKEEGKLKLSLHVRWYWSRWATLYDLAFLAAHKKNDPLLAARVADSLKSRPVAKLISMEKNMSAHDREILEAVWGIETNFAAGNFQVNYNRAATAKQTSDGPDTIDFKVTKKGWSVIHLYISKNQTVYAVVFNDNDSSSVIELGEITKTWEHYQDWKTVLLKEPLSDTNNALKELCESCGKMLEKAFQKVKNENHILFVPHGFLHLVPLHASFINGQPLFMTRKCLFLPAWWLYPRENQGIRSNGSLLLTNWAQPHDLTDFIDHSIWLNDKKVFCTPDDCVNSLTGCKDDFSWQLIVFYCHGQANYSNPYQSALKMAGGPLTHQTIAQLTDPCFTGAQVILTACETDVVYDGASESDEHLSLAAAFLQKKAAAVCGTLFKSPPDISSNIICAAANTPDHPLHETLLTIQRDNYHSPDDLYRLAPYRVMGMI